MTSNEAPIVHEYYFCYSRFAVLQCMDVDIRFPEKILLYEFRDVLNQKPRIWISRNDLAPLVHLKNEMQVLAYSTKAKV